LLPNLVMGSVWEARFPYPEVMKPSKRPCRIPATREAIDAANPESPANLHKLGCSEEQVQRHMLRGEAAATSHAITPAAA